MGFDGMDGRLKIPNPIKSKFPTFLESSDSLKGLELSSDKMLQSRFLWGFMESLAG